MKDGDWADKRSRKIAEKYKGLLEKVDENVSQEQKDALFLEANPRNKKQRMLGMGNFASSLGSTATSSQLQGSLFTQEDVTEAVNVAVQLHEEKIKVEMEKQMEKQKLEMEERLQQQKEEQNLSLAALNAKIEMLMRGGQFPNPEAQ